MDERVKVSLELALDWLRHLEAGDTIMDEEMRHLDYLVGFLDAAVDRRLDEQARADYAGVGLVMLMRHWMSV